jgi:hypothetical protein
MNGRHRFSGLSKGRVTARGEMNRTETKYANELQLRKLAGEIVDYWFEPFSLRLSSPPEGQPARYTPDFMVLMPDGLTVVDDVKGTGPDDLAAIVRIKTAAERFPLWKFRIVKQQTKKSGGGWVIKDV